MMAAGNVITKLVVGTDGSADAARGVRYASDLARQLGVPVVLVHALTLLEHLPGRPIEAAQPLRDEIGRLLASAWAEPLVARGVAHDTVLEDGPPLMVLPRVAQRVGADLIVVASHGRGGAHGLPLGSTSHGLLQTAGVPVVVVPTRRSDKEG